MVAQDHLLCWCGSSDSEHFAPDAVGRSRQENNRVGGDHQEGSAASGCMDSTSRFVNIVVMAIVAALLLQVLFWYALLRPRSFLDAHGPIQIVLAA